MGKCCGSFKKNVKHRNLGNSRKKNSLQLNSYNLQFGEVPQIVGYVYIGGCVEFLKTKHDRKHPTDGDFLLF